MNMRTLKSALLWILSYKHLNYAECTSILAWGRKPKRNQQTRYMDKYKCFESSWHTQSVSLLAFFIVSWNGVQMLLLSMCLLTVSSSEY